MNKIFANADLAVADIADGSTVMVGGFGLCGIPETLIHGRRPQEPARLENHLQQRRRRRLWYGPDARGRHDRLACRQLRGRKQAAGRDGDLQDGSISNSLRRALLQNVFARVAQASLRSTPQPEWVRSLQKAKRYENLEGAGTCSSTRCTPTSP